MVKNFRRSVKLAKASLDNIQLSPWVEKQDVPLGWGVSLGQGLVLWDSTLIGFLSTCAQQPSNSISRLISSTNIGLCALKVCLSIFIFIYISEMLCWPPMGDYITWQRWLCLRPLPFPHCSPLHYLLRVPTHQFSSLPQSCWRSFPSHFHRAHKMTLDQQTPILHCLKWVATLILMSGHLRGNGTPFLGLKPSTEARSPTWSGLGRNRALPLTNKCMS